MLEKMLAPLPSPKADPRAMLRANERSAVSDRADEARDDGAGGFGQVLAEDAAARRMAQKPADPRSERPRHEKRSEAGKSETQHGRSTPTESTESPEEEPVSETSGHCQGPVGLAKRNPIANISDGPACQMPGEVQLALEDQICVGMPLPTNLEEVVVAPELIEPQPLLPSEICIGVANPEVRPETDLPIIAILEDATQVDVNPVPVTPEITAELVESLAAADPGLVNLHKEATPIVPGAVPTVALVDGAEITGEEPALSVSLDAQRKPVLPQAVETAPLDKAQVDVTLAQGLPETKATRTSVPLIPLEAAASTRTNEGKGFLHNAEAISGPANGFAELMRDFAPHQGMSGLRGVDPFSALDRPGMIGMAAQDNQRPTPLQMLPIEMGMQAMRGNTRFQIRLDPPELGRVDVKLEISSSGEVKANMVVDRVETLAILRRDSQSLQQAFEQAGLKQSPDGLTFSLRGEGQNGQQAQDRREDQGRSGSQDNETALLETAAAEKAMRRVFIPLSRIDLVI